MQFLATKKVLLKLIGLYKEFAINKQVQRKNYLIQKNIESTLAVIPSSLNKEYMEKWSKLCKRVDTQYLKLAATLSDQISPNFVPENIYYFRIEPTLNNRLYTLLLADKNFYDIFFCDNVFPKVLLRKINREFYDAKYNPMNINSLNISSLWGEEQTLLIKPSTQSSGGKNIRVFKRKSGDCFFEIQTGEKLTLEYLNYKYPNNFTVQEYINQNSYYDRFNSTSLNTVRFYVYRSVVTQQVHILQAVLRIGKPGNIVDNQAAGGISCGIDKNGELSKHAIDKYGRKQVIPNYNLGNSKIYMFKEMKDIALRLTSKLLYSHVHGFDFCVDDADRVKLLEINFKNIEINFMQMNNGPLFGDYTDEVIEYCQKTPISFNFGYYL